ncbi:MAG: GYD domain-containing protein [Thermoplasmata archaeon]
MPNYVILGKWTEQGIRTVKDSPKRVETVKAIFEKAGGKLDLWYTMGDYDFVGVANAPNDEAYMQIAFQLGALGNVRTTTLKAWSVLEAAKVINKL